MICITPMGITAALRGYPGVVFDLDSNMSSTTVLLLYGTATLDEVAVPVRYRICDGDDPKKDFAPIPNLSVVPSSPAMADVDLAIAEDADRNDWFAEILRSCEGDDTVFYLDFPASYGKMPYSVLSMLDEDDSVIPSIKAGPKDVKLVKRLTDELERVRDKNRGRRSVPGRPTLNHLLLTGTPMSTYNEAAARRATAVAAGDAQLRAAALHPVFGRRQEALRGRGPSADSPTQLGALRGLPEGHDTPRLRGTGGLSVSTGNGGGPHKHLGLGAPREVPAAAAGARPAS
ncbi:hypothetical protein ABZY02_34160 [Streptomyces sp. NPDC006649]|uniref:ParA family protein n=1 Tax=Streptomyces sp. NPDC006649 TaxID=3156896 RepID=UPI0033A5E53F